MVDPQAPGTLAPASPLERRAEARIRELEHKLERVQAHRHAQATAVQSELDRLAQVYGRLRTDLETAREERDRAILVARAERQLRTREKQLLAREIDTLKGVRSGSREGVDNFVAERLAQAPGEIRELTDGAVPEVAGYDVLEFIGRGGMAAVFRAKRLADGRHVAIKLLRGPGATSSTRTELFLREAAMMLRLDHPGLLRALDAGHCAHGRYLTLELAEGDNLARRLRRDGPMSESAALDLGLQVADALSYCARLGLTHRDVKPSNLLEVDGRVKICDFGLAAFAEGDRGRPYGSPGYAAPEQLLTPDDVDERADIYALGCTLWSAVCGRRPFPGSTQEAFAAQRVLDLTDPRFDGADISQGLALVIRRMARRDRESRYRRWEECVMDLTLVSQGNPPFAAQLAEALEPDDATVEYDGEPVPPADEPDRDSPTPASEAQTSEEFASGRQDQTPAPPRPTVTIRAPVADPESEEDTEEDVAPARPGPPAPAAETLPVPVTAAAQATEPARAHAEATPATPAAGVVPGGEPSRAIRWFLASAACVLAMSLGALVQSARAPDPLDTLVEGARRMAAEGRAAEAAESLRQAAAVLPPGQAARLRALADTLEAPR